MRWNKYTIKTTTEAEDMIAYTLAELGIEGVEIEDKLGITEEEKKAVFADFVPELPPDDGVACVSFYIDADLHKDEAEGQLAEVRNALLELKDFVNIGEASISKEEINEDEFKDKWKEFFHTFVVDNDILIRPSWEELPADAAKYRAVLSLDPGTAFGTGEHETTKLCMINLKKYIKEGFDVIDIGCGSGILSVLAKELGAARVCGTDIDEIAVDVAVENSTYNNIPAVRKDVIKEESDLSAATMTFGYTDLFDSEVRRDMAKAFGGGAHMVVANILADVIIPIAGFVKELLREDGIFVSSGIYVNRIEEVKKAFAEAGLTVVEMTTMGDWNSFVCKK